MKIIFNLKTSLSLFALSFYCCNPYAFPNINTSPEKVGRDKLTITDRSQHGTIEVQLFYPVSNEAKVTPNTTPYVYAAEAWNAPVKTNQKLPLIVISHGWGGNPQFLAWFADALVNKGFFVAIPQHISDITTPPSFNYWHRPLDISLTITKLLDSKYKSNIDPNRIGFAGYSLGGTTGIWLAGGIAKYYERNIFPGEQYANPNIFIKKTAEEIANTDINKGKSSFKDSRIKAEFLMAPAMGWQFDQNSLNSINIPIYIAETSGDTVLVPQANAFYFAENIPTATLKMLPGKADHFIFRAEIKADKIKEFDPTGNLSFNYKDDPSINRASIHNEVAELAIKFFEENLNYNEAQRNIETVTNAYVELDQKNDPNAMQKFFTKDYELFRNNLSPQSYQQLYEEVIARKKKINSIVTTPFQDIIACGNKVVVRYNFKVNMVDGKTATGKAIAIFELENGKIKRTWALDMGT